jgi:phage terminase large subunit-like protein
LIDELMNEDGFSAEQVLAVPQTFAGMSSGCLTVQAAVLEGWSTRAAVPLMAWSAANASSAGRERQHDVPGEEKEPRAHRSDHGAGDRDRNLAIRMPPAQPNVYLERGIIELGQ